MTTLQQTILGMAQDWTLRDCDCVIEIAEARKRELAKDDKPIPGLPYIGKLLGQHIYEEGALQVTDIAADGSQTPHIHYWMEGRERLRPDSPPAWRICIDCGLSERLHD